MLNEAKLEMSDVSNLKFITINKKQGDIYRVGKVLKNKRF